MLLPLTMLFAANSAHGAQSSTLVDVLTQRYNNNRTGANLSETTLNTSNVNENSFGKLFSLSVDAQIYAQPLIATGLKVNGAIHNVVYVCTENNSVYAFDADTTSSSPLWQKNFGTPIPASDYSGVNLITPSIGIVSTPVIDKVHNTIFLVTHTKINGVYAEDLHALNLQTGAEQPNSPVLIQGTVSGTGDGSSNGQLAFDPFRHMNRPALGLDKGRVYVAFASHGDQGPYHGWVFAYNETTLANIATYCTTPNGSEGGIWMSGGGPVLDSQEDLTFTSGNGSYDASQTGVATGNSFFKLHFANNAFKLYDYYTPYNSGSMNSNDYDLGSTGPILLPGTNTLLAASKDGSLFVVNLKNMGKYNANADQNLQRIAAFPSRVFGGFAAWNSPDEGLCAYVWGAEDSLKRFQVNSNGTLVTTPTQQSSLTCPNNDPGGVPIISANGSAAGTGILWATVSTSSTSASGHTITGELCAYDATNITNPLWTSETNSSRDSFGNLAKFCPPVVANGKVYMATFSNQLVVYGLLPNPQVAKTNSERS